MKNYFILTTLLATALFSGCSNEEITPQADEGQTQVNFVLGDNGIVTKSITEEGTNGYATKFVADESMGIYASGAATATNSLYTVSSDGNTLKSTSPITIASTGTAKFTAYAPYDAAATTDEVSFTVKSNQSTAANFNASNLLTATVNDISASSPTVSLTFAPRLALVRVEMAGTEGLTTTEVMANALPTVTWTASTDAVSEASGTATDITLLHQNAGATDAVTSQIFTAFVPAQTIAGGSTFLSMTVGEKQYVFKPNTNFDLQAGKINKIRVTIGETGEVVIDAIGISVNDWEVNTTEISGTVEEIEPEPEPAIVLIEKITVDAETNLQSCTGLVGTKEGWNALVVTSYQGNTYTNSIEVDETEKAFKLTDTGAALWHQKMLIYRTANNAGSLAKYKLTFMVKTEGGKEICVRVMKGQTTGVFTSNAYFTINNAYRTAGEPLTTTTTWTEQSVTIDFAKLNGADASATDLQYGIMFCFKLKTDTDADTVYIKDVECIETTE